MGFAGPASYGGQVISFKSTNGDFGKYVIVQQYNSTKVMNFAEVEIKLETTTVTTLSTTSTTNTIADYTTSLTVCSHDTKIPQDCICSTEVCEVGSTCVGGTLCM